MPNHSLTTPSSVRTRWIRRSSVAAVAALLALPGIALAHLALRSSLPAANSTGAAPHELRLTFSEKPELAVSRVTLVANGADTVATGTLAADPKAPETMIVPISKHPAPGAYTVYYRVAGRDGHPLSGSFSFTVAAPK